MSKQKPKTKKPRKRERIKKVIDQAKEPLSLLGTLKEEGISNLMTLITLGSAVASGATKNLKMENLKPVLTEVFHSLGVVYRQDLERLEARVEELENKIGELELEKLKDFSREEE